MQREEGGGHADLLLHTRPSLPRAGGQGCINLFHFIFLLILSFYPRSASRTAVRQARSTPALDEHSLASSNSLETGSESNIFSNIFSKTQCHDEAHTFICGVTMTMALTTTLTYLYDDYFMLTITHCPNRGRRVKVTQKCWKTFSYICCVQFCSVKFNVPYHITETITQSKLCGLYEKQVIAASALAATTIATILLTVFFSICG